MNALTFTLRRPPQQRVDLALLSCQRIAGLSTAEINAIELQCGKRRLRVDELFELSGSNNREIVFRNSCDKLDRIGHELDGGEITVEGDAGAYCGLGMKSGSIRVRGSAGIFAACEMHDGMLQIEGAAGDFLGGALPGNKRGMQGGMVIVKGSAGDRLGDQMRRGMVLVEGNVGDYCGSRMIAGTIAVMGTTGYSPGYSMNRGTLLLWRTPKLIATFADCGTHTSSSFLPLLFRSWRSLNSRFAEPKAAFSRIHRYQGDLSALGKGEILVKS
jgi:formylmethanofuran dehydrogenase subunit C